VNDKETSRHGGNFKVLLNVKFINTVLFLLFILFWHHSPIVLVSKKVSHFIYGNLELLIELQHRCKQFLFCFSVVDRIFV